VGFHVYQSIGANSWVGGWVDGVSHGWAAVGRRSKVGRRSGRERRRFGKEREGQDQMALITM
jgi:hypothetical protein